VCKAGYAGDGASCSPALPRRRRICYNGQFELRGGQSGRRTCICPNCTACAYVYEVGLDQESTYIGKVQQFYKKK
jgi:hypothetical protein